MVHDFVRALSEMDVIIHDHDFVLEAQTFVADGKGSYNATDGNHDDVIMGTLIGYQGVLDSPKYPIFWNDPVQAPATHDEFDAVAFSDKRNKAEDQLERAIGKHDEPVKVVRTITLTPANFKSGPF
jgi:hypothetical protein